MGLYGVQGIKTQMVSRASGLIEQLYIAEVPYRKYIQFLHTIRGNSSFRHTVWRLTYTRFNKQLQGHKEIFLYHWIHNGFIWL